MRKDGINGTKVYAIPRKNKKKMKFIFSEFDSETALFREKLRFFKYDVFIYFSSCVFLYTEND